MTSQFNVSPLSLSEVHRRRAIRATAWPDDDAAADAGAHTEAEGTLVVELRGDR